jgi:hypothetical protein
VARDFRENAAGEVEVFAHRAKSFLLLAGMAAFTALGIALLAVDPTEPWAWATIILFGGGGAVTARRSLRTGVLSGKPALVIGPSGVRARMLGMTIPWEDVERVASLEVSTRGGTQRFLAFHLKDPDAFFERRGGVAAKVAPVLTRLPFPGSGAVQVHVNFLAASADELVAIVRRYWRGPIEHEPEHEVELDETGMPIRPPRRVRFLRWARDAAITVAIVVAIILVIEFVL